MLMVLSNIPPETDAEMFDIEGVASDDGGITMVTIRGGVAGQSEFMVKADVETVSGTQESVKFQKRIPLYDGENNISIDVQDTAGQVTRHEVTVFKTLSAPPASSPTPSEGTEAGSLAVAIRVDSDSSTIVPGSISDIMLEVDPILPSAQFLWTLNGPGFFEGQVTDPAIFYIPPEQIDETPVQTTITVTVTDEHGKTTSASVVFTFTIPEER